MPARTTGCAGLSLGAAAQCRACGQRASRWWAQGQGNQTMVPLFYLAAHGQLHAFMQGVVQGFLRRVEQAREGVDAVVRVRSGPRFDGDGRAKLPIVFLANTG